MKNYFLAAVRSASIFLPRSEKLAEKLGSGAAIWYDSTGP